MIPLFKVHIPPEAKDAVLLTLYGGYVGQGPRVDEFERALEPWMGVTPATVNSGTAALVLAYRLAGVRPGDLVVTTPMTCTATNLPILAAGARPVWADVDPASGLLTPATLEDAFRRLRAARGNRPRAVVCVDWGGMPCEIETLRTMAWNEGALLIEDAAHALGARRHGRRVGELADLTAFSFQAIKHITTVDGGALACLSDEHRRRARRLRWYGIDRDAPAAGDSRIDVEIEEWGYKAHMNDVAAALGLAQLPHLLWILLTQAGNADFFDRHLPLYFARPVGPEGSESAWWLYTVRLGSRSERDAFRRFMLGKGIQVSQVHRRNDDYAVFRHGEHGPAARGVLSGVDEFGDRMVCLPVHWALTDADCEAIVDACQEFAGAGGDA